MIKDQLARDELSIKRGMQYPDEQVEKSERNKLIKYDAACKALAEAVSVDEVKDLRDKAIALKEYARQANNMQLEIDAAEIRFRAERRLGELLKESEKHPPGRYPSSPSRDIPPTLSELGISYDLSSRAQAIAAIPEEDFEQTLAEHREEQQAITGRTIEKLAGKAHVSNNSGEYEWYTPPEFIEAARQTMGGIDVDPASCEAANKIVKAKTFYSEKDNGLMQKWKGNVFLNPPYSQPLINLFSQEVTNKYISKEITQAVILVNNATETAWFQRMMVVCSSVCFPDGRIKFIDKNGVPKGAPLQGQAIIYFGDKPQTFAINFSKFGCILCADK